jgi:hypothetical protein
MAPIAITPDSSNTASPNGDRTNGFFSTAGWNGSPGGAASQNRGLSNWDANGHTTHGHTNRHHTDGHTNGRTETASNDNGHSANGHSDSLPTNGHGTANGSSNGVDPGSKKSMPIAIIGMACRLPGNVATPAEFWELCTRARTGWTEIPKDRFNAESFYHPNPGKGGCFNPVGGNFLNVDLAAFDAPFFGLTEKEAISMDPQQRLLLECTFEALESAGIPKHTIVGKDVGVFVGGSFPEYESHLFRDPDTVPMHQATGSSRYL